MAKKIDPKAKAKRQKIYAAIGGVLLLGLLAFQVPRTMKMLNQSGVDSASSSSAPASTTSAAPTAGGASVTASAGSGALVDPDVVPAPQSGQLLAFGRFRTKDPFAQQLDDSCTADSDPTDGSATACSTSPKAAESSAQKPPASSPRAVSAAPRPAKAALTAALISVNGEAQRVRVGDRFPSSDPAFTLVSVTRSTAKIAIAGGSFETGQANVTLRKNKRLTLMNTADGTRYVLRLLSVS